MRYTVKMLADSREDRKYQTSPHASRKRDKALEKGQDLARKLKRANPVSYTRNTGSTNVPLTSFSKIASLAVRGIRK